MFLSTSAFKIFFQGWRKCSLLLRTLSACSCFLLSFCPVSRMGRTRILLRMYVHLMSTYPRKSVGFTSQIPTQSGPLPLAPHCASTLPRAREEVLKILAQPVSSVLALYPPPLCSWPSNTAALHWDLLCLRQPCPFLSVPSLACCLYQENFLDLPKTQLGTSRPLLHTAQV